MCAGGGSGGGKWWLEVLVKVERICSFLGVFLFFTRRSVLHITLCYTNILKKIRILNVD